MNREERVESPMPDYLTVHRLAFSPLMFQAARVARDNGVLEAVARAGAEDISPEKVAETARVSLYAARVLLEACDSLGLVTPRDGRYAITKAGKLVLYDELTRVNMDFTHHVCYLGAFYLESSLETRKPEGLKVFGDYPTLYEGLARLPEKVKQSWLSFDHYFSDRMFPAALKTVFERHPKRVLDVGANTGKWAVACTRHDPAVKLTLLDHAAQLEMAYANAEKAGVRDRIEGRPMDLLDHQQPFPQGYDVVWMSQFLDCFPEEDIVALLRRGARALNPDGRLYVVETYWDRQPNEIARLCLQATSLYFACMANGKSRMYHSNDLKRCIAEAELKIVEEQQILFHTVFACVPY